MKKEVENFYTGLSSKVKLKIRKKAEANAIQQAIRYGKCADEYEKQEWRRILKEEENAIIKNMEEGRHGITVFLLCFRGYGYDEMAQIAIHIHVSGCKCLSLQLE